MDGWHFYTLVIGFVCGVALASVYTVSFPVVVYVAFVAGVMGVIARARSEASGAGNVLLLSLFLTAFTVGVVRFNLSAEALHFIDESLIDTYVTFVGVVVREPDVREKVTHIYVRVDNELLLVKTNRYAQVSYGDKVVLQGRLENPKSFQTDLGRTFHYPEYLHARGVWYIVSFAQVEVIETGYGNIFISKILSLKHAFMQRIEQIIPEPHVGLAEGLLLGVKQALGGDLEQIFRKTGIIHIVVLSGYNVTLVVLFITYVLSYIIPFHARVWFGLVAIICFALLVGLSATVMRASIMASLVLVAGATGRIYAVIRALMLAGIIMILINPYVLVYDVGFQLSFLATLGLIFFAPHIERLVTFMPTLFQMREFLTATIATQLFVLPILLYSIGEFSLIAVVVNVLVLPMVPVAMLLTFITGVVSFFSPLIAVFVGYGTYLSLQYIISIATFFSKVPFASFSVNAFSFGYVVLGYVLIGWVVYLLFRKNEEHQLPEVSDDVKEIESWVVEEEEVVNKRIRE